MIWWLSFADAERPEGERFLGVCIVEGMSLIDAVLTSHAKGCNPGGEVRGFPIPQGVAGVPDIDHGLYNRLMRKPELERAFGPMVNPDEGDEA